MIKKKNVFDFGCILYWKCEYEHINIINEAIF